MTRFLPLVIFVIWICTPQLGAGVLGPAASIALFLGVYLVLVLLLRGWAIALARGAHRDSLKRRLHRFNLAVAVARMMVPVWFGVAVFILGWKTMVDAALAHMALGRFHLDGPGLILGSLPALLAWMSLWWAQFPADQALREHNMVIQLEQGLPTHPPPGFWAYVGVNLRLQLLFAIAPALLLILLRDVLSIALPPLLNQIDWLRHRPTWMEGIISLPSFVLILVLGPEILRRVLQTESMPDCPLRRRLEWTCRQNRIGFRKVLTWRTRHQMGNAAVMGFIPQVRYILLSDLLLETMSDQQIEAVFAHEVGHVKHRHLWWLLLTMAAMLLAFAGPGQLAVDALVRLHQRVWLPQSLQLSVLLAGGMGVFALVFGYISRRFERQADVFAARTMQNLAAVLTGAYDDAGPSLRSVAKSHVGRRGAQIFCSALERVASVNNIPIAARSWCHGSIARRMRFVQELSEHPARTVRFDRSMARLYLALTLGLCLFAGWTMLTAS